MKKNIHKNCHLQFSWDKYGADNFEFFILYECEIEQEINIAEIFYIQWYRDLELVYNLSSGGEGGLHHEETRQKLREAWTEERRQKYRDAQTGKKASEESIQKRKDLYTEERRQKQSEVISGRKHTEESKQKMKNYWTEEKRQERSKVYTGGNNGHIKPIIQYSKDGKFLKRYNYIKDAYKALDKIYRGDGLISNCATKNKLELYKNGLGKLYSSMGFVWKYE